MRRTTVLLMVAMLVVAGVPATAAFAQESSSGQPGATFAGVVGVQGAEVEGEVAQRSLDRRLANADSNTSKAAVVAGETENARTQLAELRERRETLERRYESGEMTRGEYRSRLAQIGAQIRTLERRLNATATAAEGLPEETLRERGVNASAIAELRRNASEMGGGAVAEAARGIGGADTGKGLSGDPGPPGDAGPPGNAGNGNAGPPGDAGSGNDGGEGAVGASDDRGNANRSEAAGENGGADDGAAGDRGNGNRSMNAGEEGENRTDNENPPGASGDTNDSDGDRGNAGSAGDGTTGSANAGAGSGSGDSANGADAGGGTDSNDAGGDERRGNGNGPSDDGTATPTVTPEDGVDRRVDDGQYLALR